MKRLALTSCFSLLFVAGLSAQETSHFTFNLGAGFTEPVGATGRYLDTGWNIQGGAGYNFSSYVGALINLEYDSMGINSTTLSSLGFPGGGVNVFSASLDPIVHLNPHGHIDFYLTGGAGMYRREQNFSAPSVATFVGGNPFFGFFPVAVPTTEILSSYSVIKPGVDGGAGVAFGTKWHGKFFAEARYHRIIMGNGLHTDYVPVSFGFRW